MNGRTRTYANESLIGSPEAQFLAKAATPALCIDLGLLRANLATLQATARRYGKAVRPHMKAHKSAQIARLQMETGAIGISCATAREASLAARHGIKGILLTTPLVTPLAVVELVSHRADLTFAVDSIEGIDRIAACGAPVGMVVDINVGQNRTGVASAAEAAALKRHIASKPNLTFRGIQAYYGHLQHIADIAARRERVAAHWGLIAEAHQAVGGDVVTGGGTGTHLLDLAEGPFTEIQPGSYLFMDSQYGAVEIGTRFGVSLSLLARVTSSTVANQVVIDAGTKAISTDSATMCFLTSGFEGAAHRFMGDEHSAIGFPPGSALPAIGAPVRMIATHCDPTVNLHDHVHIFEGGRLVDIWPIEARGY